VIAVLTRPSLLAIAATLLPLAACDPGASHRNFLQVMGGNVGTNADRQYNYRVKRRDRLVDTRQLPNGNVEEQFTAGHGQRCRVFFEVDQKNQKVVAWRYEGAEKDCAINP